MDLNPGSLQQPCPTKTHNTHKSPQFQPDPSPELLLPLTNESISTGRSTARLSFTNHFPVAPHASIHTGTRIGRSGLLVNAKCACGPLCSANVHPSHWCLFPKDTRLTDCLSLSTLNLCERRCAC